MKHSILPGAALLLGGVALGRLSAVNRQVDRHRRAWEDHNLATLQNPRPGAYLVAALGDSSTQGVGSERTEEGFVPRFAAHVQEHLGSPVEVLNFSTSGATVETILVHQLPALQAGPEPDLVIVNFGGNDVGVSALTPDVFRKLTRKLLRQLPAGTLVGNIPSFSFLREESRAAELSKILDQEVLDAGHHVVDLRGFSSRLGTVEYLARYHAADLFHPNARAYRAWTHLFFQVWMRLQHQEIPAKHPRLTPFRIRSLRCDLALEQLAADMETE